MSSFQDEKKKERRLMLTVNIIITIILGIGILAIWLDKRQDMGDKVSVGILYLITLIFYLLIP